MSVFFAIIGAVVVATVLGYGVINLLKNVQLKKEKESE